MKIPKKIKISGHDINILKKKNVIVGVEPCFGCAVLQDSRIELASHFLSEKLPESRIAETFLHEIIHMICNIHGIKLTERETNTLGLALFQVIRDHKLRF